MIATNNEYRSQKKVKTTAAVIYSFLLTHN